MKKTVLIILYCFGYVLCIQNARAAEPGFSGDIIIGGVWETAHRSQLDATDGNERIETLTENEKRDTQVTPHITGELSYTFSNRQTALFVTDLNYDSGLALGVRQELGDWGLISVAGTIEAQDVWKDPYLTGVKRSRTAETSAGVLIAYESILGTGLQITSHLTQVDVDQDHIGKREKDLRRDGHRYTMTLGYRIALNDNNVITPSLAYVGNDLEGEANASEGMAFSMAYAWTDNQWHIEAGASVGSTSYRGKHPIFDKKHSASTVGASLVIGYYEPFGLPQVSVYSLLTYSRIQDDIDFFNSAAVCAGLGLGSHF